MNSIFASVFLILNVVFSSLTQILLKQEAVREHSNKFQTFINLRVILSYTIFIFITLFNIFLYKYIEYKYVMVLESVSFISILVVSKIFLKEIVDKKQIIGVVLIIFGILIYVIN